MSESNRVKYLRIALILVGLIFVVGIYPLTIIWPSGWSWHTGQSEYLQMILGVYATLGVFLLVASRDPLGIEISFGSPCGPASCTPALWRRRVSRARIRLATCGAMYPRYLALRQCWRS